MRLDLTTGLPDVATFVQARQSQFDANTWTLENIGYDATGNIVLHGSSFFSPLNTDLTIMYLSSSMGEETNYRLESGSVRE